MLQPGENWRRRSSYSLVDHYTRGHSADLGVILENYFTTSASISSVCRSAFCFLCQLRPVVQSLSVDAEMQPRPWFTRSSRLAWTIATLFSTASPTSYSGGYRPHKTLRRLITGTGRCDHITLVLQQLHWLPMRQQVEFKIALLV